VIVAAAKDGLVRDVGEEPTAPAPTLAFSLWCLGFLFLFGGLPLTLNLFDSLSELTAVVVALLSALTVTCVFRSSKLTLPVPGPVYLCAIFYLTLSAGLLYFLVVESNLLGLWGGATVLLLGTLTWAFRKR
jgi:hypothetical protein